MSAQNERNLMKMIERVGEHVVRSLSDKYGFDSKEASEFLKLGSKVVVGVKEEKKKSSIPVPFCGEIMKDKCETIRLNHGLYTQCTNISSEERGEHNVCGTCDKQISKNTNGMPTYGYITERVEKGDKFRDPKGKAPANYGNVILQEARMNQ